MRGVSFRKFVVQGHFLLVGYRRLLNQMPTAHLHQVQKKHFLEKL